MGKDVPLFAASLFGSAFLLFQVELIVSKWILPWFGGSAAVWTTCTLVFQLLVLGAYIYAHLLSTRLRSPGQIAVHLALLALAVLQVIVLSILWPSAITPSASWWPAASQHPTGSVVWVLLVSAGLPFFLLSSTAPLLQRWLVFMGGTENTYRLYSISNLGSLAGLLIFPFLTEPTLSTRRQGQVWCLAFCLLAIALALCAGRVKKVPIRETAQCGAAEVSGSADWLRRLLWFMLASCASALFLATTNLLCQEMTSLPLLWVLPLTLYLMSFVLCFDHPRWYSRAVLHPLYAVTITLAALALDARNYQVQIVLLPMALFLTCMVCHGELARSKPGVGQLTAFYLSISAGGAAGGIFTAIVAPWIFSSFAELQLMLAIGAMLFLLTLFLEKESWLYRRDLWMPAAIGAGALLTVLLGGQVIGGISKVASNLHYLPLVGLSGLVSVAGGYLSRVTNKLSRHRFLLMQSLAVILALPVFLALFGSTAPEPGEFVSLRSFYGVVRVVRDAQGVTRLENGQTTHGSQLPPPDDRVPTTYYGPNSTIGIVLMNHPNRSTPTGNLRVGIIGLGAGTLAAYGRAGDYFRFYEIDPDVVRIAGGSSPVFTYLRQSQARIDVMTGDARFLLENETAAGHSQGFDVLVLDAFSGDAIPVHLLTREAFQAYLHHLTPNGIIAVHMSSRHLNLEPVLHGIIEELMIEGRLTHTIEEVPFRSSLWMLLSARHEMLEIRGLDQIGQGQRSADPPILWTDDFSSILRLLRW